MMEQILTDIFLLRLSKKINLVNVTAVGFSIYLGFSAADGTAAAMGANIAMYPESAFNTILSRFVMKHGRKSESALNLRKRFLENGMKDAADYIKAELEKFGIPFSSDEETLMDTPVSLPSSPDDRQGQTKIDAEEAITNGMAPWNRSRIMVVGPAGVGKTSLIRRLTEQEFNPHEKSTKGAEQNIVTNNKVSSWIVVNDAKTAKDDLVQSIALYRESRSNRSGATNQLVTEGADRSVKVLSTSGNEKIAIISKGITHEEITKVKSSELGITYSMWDFGGQEIYYITHPLFLSWRALYILVIPLNLELSERAPREEDAENAQKQLKGSAVRTHRTILDLVNFWLMSVYTHAVPDSQLDSTYEPKVLIIGTFLGGESMRISKKKLDSKVQELKDLIGSRPYRKQVLFPICVIDNQFSQGSEVKEIQDRIDGLIKESKYMQDPKPVRWRTFLTEIEGSDQNTLTVTEARSTMTSLGINDNEMDDVLQFYHDIGHLIYHQGCELIVLKPQFLNSIVSNIITVIDDKKMKGDLAKYWTDLLEKGILSIELIQDVWEEHKGVHDQLNDIIDMMIIFDLICEIPDMPDGRRRFFVPCRSSPKLHKKECYDKDHTVEFTIDFHHFLPDGFLHRFYVRMAKWSMEKKKSIKPTFHCRKMMFYVDSRHRLVMKNKINGTKCHQIKVKVNAVVPFSTQSERKPATVNLNENLFDDLHDTLDDLKERWAGRIEYSVGILCPNCSKHGQNKLIPIRDILTDQDEVASCDDGCPIDVSDILRAFNKGTKTSLGKITPSQGASAAASGVFSSTARSTNRAVTKKEIVKLSKLLPDGKYSELCGILGFEYNYIKKIKKNNFMDSTPAFEELLHEWKDKAGSIEDLDAALKEAELGGLVSEYKN